MIWSCEIIIMYWGYVDGLYSVVNEQTTAGLLTQYYALNTQQCQHPPRLQTLSVLLNIESGQLWMFGICW